MTSASKLVVNAIVKMYTHVHITIIIIILPMVLFIFIKPYTYIQWLEEEFLPYLDSWEYSVQEREGYCVAEKNKMLLSVETRLGLKFTGIVICGNDKR